MSYGGHALDALNRMRQNRSLSPKNRAKFKENVRQPINTGNNKTSSNKKFSEKELLEAKRKIVLDNKIGFRNDVIAFAIAITIVLSVLAYAYISLKS